MSRKTWSFGAVAAFAIANVVFSSAHSAETQAENGIAPSLLAVPNAEIADDGIERMPDQPLFVSQEIVQPLPGAQPEAVPVVTSASSLGAMVQQMEPRSALSEEMKCLAGAVYFEARGEPLAGQLAVAQVIINRTEDPRFPASYCAVVQQQGQFSFIKRGRMPDIRTASPAWAKARAIAEIAHHGLWQSEAEGAVFFHARYVRPQWSHRKQRLAQIDTHIFYR
jgi:spore germination cell wall hydrolase CwlJ-like protein